MDPEEPFELPDDEPAKPETQLFHIKQVGSALTVAKDGVEYTALPCVLDDDETVIVLVFDPEAGIEFAEIGEDEG